VLEASLGIAEKPRKLEKEFEVTASDLQLRPGIDPLKLKEFLSDLEVEEYLAQEKLAIENDSSR